MSELPLTSWLIAEGEGAAVPLTAVTGLFIIPTHERTPEGDHDVWALVASQQPGRGAYVALASWPRDDDGREAAQDAFDALVCSLATAEDAAVYRWEPDMGAWGLLGLGTGDVPGLD